MKGFKVLGGALALLLGLAGYAQAQDKVAIGVPNWPSVKVTANVIKIIAEDNLGLEVELVPGTNPVIFEAMDRGKGDIDVHPEVWMPNQANLAQTYVEGKKSVEFSGFPYEAVQGMCVTKATKEKHGIKSVFDLANPETSKLFDTNGDGKGELWVGATGWASTNVEKVKAHGYGYDEFFELTTIEETLVLAQLDDAVAKDRPFVFFCYAPHHMFQLHELVMLEEPAYDESKWKMVQPTDDPEWFEKSDVAVAWPPANLYVAFSKTLHDRTPEFVTLLQNVSLDSDLVSEWTFALVVDKVDVEDYAKEWVSANSDKVDKWLGL